jgi:hypothetical protein
VPPSPRLKRVAAQREPATIGAAEAGRSEDEEES